MKTLGVVLMTTTLFAGLAHANTVMNQSAIQQQGAAVNVQAIAGKTSTVKSALAAKDDTKVKLTGTIVKYLGDERYLFRDATGVVQVDIDDDLWNGKAIHANTKLTIIGEVDVEYKPTRKVEIDVDEVQF